MKFTHSRAWGALAAAVAVTLSLAASSGAVTPSVVYNATPNALPPNVVSLGFQATQTSEFGDYVHLAGAGILNTVTVTMSDWALYSDYATDPRYAGNTATWSHPITVNVYSNHLGENGAPDTRLATVTQSIAIPWRPVADPTCPDTGYGAGFAWRSASDGQCYNGLAFNATFDLSSLNVSLPNDVIVGVAYNTQTYGTAPIGANGPYNSLNVGIPTDQTVSVGTDDSSNNVFWNTSTAGSYTDGGPGGIFRQDTGWAPNGTVAIQITASAAAVAPPTSKDQCKDGGWMKYNNPSFANQGGCVSYVANHPSSGGDTATT
jgi:hypothetical protein